MMKKILFFALLLMQAPSLWGETERETPYKNITYEVENSGANARVSVDFPVNVQEPLRRAVVGYILERLDSYRGENLAAPSDKCDEETFNTFLSELATNLATRYGEEQRDYAKSMEEAGEEYNVTFYVNIYIPKAAETEEFVSFACYFGDFEGGVHGERYSDGVTFRKRDGKRMDDIFRNDVDEAIQPVLWKAILASDDADGDSEYRKGIEDYLSMEKLELLPLPSVAFLTPEGVHIEYQYYQICPWAQGAPTAEIPIGEALPFLTKEAAKLVKTVNKRR